MNFVLFKPNFVKIVCEVEVIDFLTWQEISFCWSYGSFTNKELGMDKLLYKRYILESSFCVQYDWNYTRFHPVKIVITGYPIRKCRRAW
jgi:hypothetical protein